MEDRAVLRYDERQVLFNLHRLSILAKKKDNLERHYNALYSNKYDSDFLPQSEISCSQQLKAKPRPLSNNTTISSFRVSNLIVKKWKPFIEGKFVKECFLGISNNFFKGLIIFKIFNYQETPLCGEQKRCVET
jgi:hypothetical protein